MTQTSPPRFSLRQVRGLLWAFVVLAAVGVMFLLFRGDLAPRPNATKVTAATLGGPFTLVGADGKPFSSTRLEGKPYAIFFGFTRCGDVCPTTLARLVKLREEAAGERAMNIVFVTIDPDHDGPKEVGQYGELFGSPIIGLTGSKEQIDAIKRQYGIFAEPTPHAQHGQEMQHTSSVLLFDRDGQLNGIISESDPDSEAIEKIKAIVG